MKLIIDYGNTLVKVALFHDNLLLAHYSYQSVSVEQLNELLKKSEKNYSSPIKNAIVSTVINYPKDVKSWLLKNYNLIELNSSTTLPIEIGIKHLNLWVTTELPWL